MRVGNKKVGNTMIGNRKVGKKVGVTKHGLETLKTIGTTIAMTNRNKMLIQQLPTMKKVTSSTT